MATAQTALRMMREVCLSLPDTVEAEHFGEACFRVAKRITVLVQGAVLTNGTPAEIVADERVRAVYLGEEAHHG